MFPRTPPAKHFSPLSASKWRWWDSFINVMFSLCWCEQREKRSQPGITNPLGLLIRCSGELLCLVDCTSLSPKVIACLSIDAVQLKSAWWGTRETAQRWKHLLVFQRTRGWFPAPIPGCLGQPVTLFQWILLPLLASRGLLYTLAQAHAHMFVTHTHTTHRCTNLKKNLFKTVNDETRLGCSVCRCNVALSDFILQKSRRWKLPEWSKQRGGFRLDMGFQSWGLLGCLSTCESI